MNFFLCMQLIIFIDPMAQKIVTILHAIKASMYLRNQLFYYHALSPVYTYQTSLN